MGTKKNVERMKRRMGTILRRNAKLETKRHVNFIKRNVERMMVRRIVKLLPRNARLETISHVNSTKKNAKECKAGDKKACDLYKKKCGKVDTSAVDKYCDALAKKCKAGNKKACDVYEKKCKKMSLL